MEAYLKLIEDLLAQNKTTGTNHSEAMLNFTRLNVQRMQRWMKTLDLQEETKSTLSNINEKQKWTVLTEAWCGDAAHSMPILYKMAASNPLIEFEWKLRDENLELMDQYLTNGGRSIPKLIVTNRAGKELFHWGPRPEFIQKQFLQMKADQWTYDQINIELQKLYNADKGITVQREIADQLKKV